MKEDTETRVAKQGIVVDLECRLYKVFSTPQSEYPPPEPYTYLLESLLSLSREKKHKKDAYAIPRQGEVKLEQEGL